MPHDSNAIGYFGSFGLLADVSIDDELKQLLKAGFHAGYRETWDGEHSIEELFGSLLDFIDKGSSPKQAGRRMLWMGLIMATAAEHMLHKYAPSHSLAISVKSATEALLHGGPPMNGPLAEALFPPTSFGVETADEALDVFMLLSGMHERTKTRHYLELILDNCLVGSAIFPGSQGKRDLLNWWILEVVPACWCEQMPAYIYTDEWPWPPSPGVRRPPEFLRPLPDAPRE